MSEYLEGYGDRDTRREKAIRWLIIAVLVLIAGGTTLYFSFRDFSEDRLAANFIKLLKAKDYKGAYALWGCTESTPCSQYSFEEFMKDWSAAGEAEIAGGKSCDGGVIKFVRIPGREDALIWADRNNHQLSFAPWRLTPIPPGLKGRLQEWMWNMTRNCKPLISP
jgi:hypothetical protein